MCPQERLDTTRDGLSESKKLNHKLTEQNQNLQRALEDLELKESELEKHNRSLKEVGHRRGFLKARKGPDSVTVGVDLRPFDCGRA